MAANLIISGGGSPFDKILKIVLEITKNFSYITLRKIVQENDIP
ncbi:MAG: hypothetical protein SOZ02_02250 [Hallerella porci]|nr:hypothetical protein [Hallerella porci]MDY3920970.1 hypothetical protein [Hallerella porci]